MPFVFYKTLNYFYKMCHLRESVHNNKYRILSISSSRKTKNKIHANIFPWLELYWKGHRDHEIEI
mgnify:CR=1 FL=1